jgi:hyperosmotically inducible protein
MAGTATPAPSSVAGSSGGSDTAGTSSSSSGTSGSKTAASAGAVIDDSLITTKVKAALLADTEVKGTDIKVETKQGEVQLSGFVRSQAQVDKALKVAQGIEGVKKVDNKMTVKP